MPNIRVRQAVERIQAELNKVGEHIVYSGIEPKDASRIANACDDIARTAAQVAEIARQAKSR